MSHQLRSELLKLRTTSTTVVLLLAAGGLTLLAVFLEGLSPTVTDLAKENAQREMFSAVTSAVLFATFAGVIAVTSEFRYGTIRPTLLIEPRRRTVLGAKLITAALTGVGIGVMCVGIAFGPASHCSRRAVSTSR
jgi:ABC-2 type transport system permease protein